MTVVFGFTCMQFKFHHFCTILASIRKLGMEDERLLESPEKDESLLAIVHSSSPSLPSTETILAINGHSRIGVYIEPAGTANHKHKTGLDLVD